MLLQSYHDELHFLPALPSAWPTGSVSGLRARGAFSVDITWSEGVLVEACILSNAGVPCRIVDPEGELTVVDAQGAAIATTRSDWCVAFETAQVSRFRVLPRELA